MSNIFTLNLNLETLMSSEALIIGEQKMLIQQLRAAEPFRANSLVSNDMLLPCWRSRLKTGTWF